MTAAGEVKKCFTCQWSTLSGHWSEWSNVPVSNHASSDYNRSFLSLDGHHHSFVCRFVCLIAHTLTSALYRSLSYAMLYIDFFLTISIFSYLFVVVAFYWFYTSFACSPFDYPSNWHFDSFVCIGFNRYRYILIIILMFTIISIFSWAQVLIYHQFHPMANLLICLAYFFSPIFL